MVMGRPKGPEENAKYTKATLKGVQKGSGKVEKKQKKKKLQLEGGPPRGQSQSCHQCRQSIHSSKGVSEVKKGKARLKCSTCTRFWCETCLLNRYGVVKDEPDPLTWSCPVCEKKCNCSLCRRKAGKLATGILTPLVKNSGFESVSEFLDKGTDDIAKVLQWQSPDTGAEELAKKKSITTSPKPKRRRKPKPSQSKENASSLGTIEESPQRTKLTHSKYNITVEEALDTQEDSRNNASLELSSSDPNDNSPAASLHSIPPQPQSPDNTQTAPTQSPCRRSGRKRKQSQFYTPEDFRRDSPESPVQDRERKSVCFRSPVSSFKFVDDLSPKERNKSQPLSQEFIDKQKELEELRNIQIDTRKQKKEDYEQKIKEEKEAQRKLVMEEKEKERVARAEEREREREARAEDRKKLLEEKARIRDELRLSKMRSREKLKLAQSVKRQAMKEMRRLQKEKEKTQKQELLAQLKEKTREEKRRKMELVTSPFVYERTEATATLVDDSPVQCDTAGVPPLPHLPPLTLPHTPSHLHSHMLFVSEFLTTFSQPLGLKRKVGAVELSTSLASGRGMSPIYLSLLKVLVDEDSVLKKELKSKRIKDLEQASRLYLAQKNINGYAYCASETPTLEESVLRLDHLCHEALCSSTITEHLESTKERLDQIRREQRTKEREMTRRIGDSLKSLCEEGGSLEDIEQQREQFTQELKLLRESFQKELIESGDSTRNTFLGTDRYNRTYWRLQSQSGLLVEANSDGCSTWSVVDSPAQLETLMGALHPNGLHEKPLLGVLNSAINIF